MPHDPAQRAAIREIFNRCGQIADLAIGRSSEASEVVAIQVDAAALDEQFEELNGEVGFARDMGVSWDCLHRIRDSVLPEGVRDRFPV